MKITVRKEHVLAGLQMVNGVVGSRTTLPILSNVLLHAEKGKLWLTATDLEVSIRCGIEAQVAKTGVSTMPARRMLSIVRELPSDEIQLDTDEKNIAHITSGSADFKIVGLPDDEFPPIPKFDGGFSYTLDQGAFREMLQKTSYAASSDETRYVLNGVFLSFKAGKLTMVATDGRRLALVEHEVEFPKEAEAEMIVPTKSVNELLRSLGDSGPMKILAAKNQVAFEFGEVLLVSKLIDGTYPNYRQVIPSQCEERVAIERESLLTCVKRVSLLTSEKSNSIKMIFGKNKLEIQVETPDVGEAHETLPIKYAGKEVKMAFNPDFLMDPLRNMTNDEIFFEMTDSLSPGVIKSDVPFVYVLMPMRVTT